MRDIEDTVTTSLDDLDFIVEALNKTAVEPRDKIVVNVVEVVIKGGHEGLETR